MDPPNAHAVPMLTDSGARERPLETTFVIYVLSSLETLKTWACQCALEISSRGAKHTKR